MADVQQATIEPHSPTPRWPHAQTACIELDRFCIDCGYNLRTQAISLDGQTGIPVVRCPECGRFQSANDASTALRPWLDKATSVMIVAWIIILVVILINLAIAEGALSYATLDELTVHGGSTTQRIGNTITRTWSGGWGPLEVKTDVPDYKLFIITITLCSFGVAFAFGMFVVVVFPHWRRVACAAIVIIAPALVGGIIALTWWKEAPHLFTWGLAYIAAHTAAQLIGGAGGITIGRPLARLLVRILLPPGIRPRLAYLWLTDGKPLPSPR